MRNLMQVILDDEVMEHVAQLDSFIEGWRLQLAQQAESRKAAKAFEAMAATKQASSNLSRAASMHCDTHRSRRWHGQSEQRARANVSSNKAEKVLQRQMPTSCSMKADGSLNRRQKSAVYCVPTVFTLHRSSLQSSGCICVVGMG